MEFFKNKYFILTFLCVAAISGFIILINNLDFEELKELYILNEDIKKSILNDEINSNLKENISLIKNFTQICDESIKFQIDNINLLQNNLIEICESLK